FEPISNEYKTPFITRSVDQPIVANQSEVPVQPLQDQTVIANQPTAPVQPLQEQKVEANAQKFDFEIVDPSEVLSLKDKVVHINTNRSKLDLDEMNKEGLLPIHKIAIDNAVYYCSKPFKFGNKQPHVAVVGLVKINDRIYPRLFYYSQSQAV